MTNAATARPAPDTAQPPAGDTARRPRTACVVMDIDGVVVDFNDAARQLLGHHPEEVLGRPMSEVLIPARLRAAHEAGLRRYRETGQAPLLANRFEVPARCHDGTEIPVELFINRTVHEGRPAFAGRLRPLRRPASVPAELHLRADFYRALVEQSPIIVAVLDDDGVPTWHSSDAGGVFSGDGRTLSDQLVDIVHPADLQKARAALGRAVHEGLDDAVELRVNADGSWRAVSLLARNLLAHPAVHGTALYVTDITRARAAERQAQVEAARLMTLIESLNVAILLQDEQRRVVLANAAFVEMFSLGVTPERLRGTGGGASSSPLAALYADAEDVERRTEAAIRRGRALRGEEIPLIDGRVLERDYVPIMLDGSTLGFLWVFRDITAQAEIRRGLEERARILSDLATLKTEFVGVVSHELRTPLTSINTFATLLEEDAETLSADERTAAMTAIRRNTDRMLGLVADLILLAKLESGELVLEESTVGVPALVRAAAGASESRHVDLRLDLHDGPELTGDGGLLAQLLDTAIGVLVVGSSPGAEVVVSAGPVVHAETTGCVEPAGSAEPKADGWRVTVRTSAADTATAERLLSTRLPHPDAVNERRTGALAVMLARAIASRHGGGLAIAVREPGVELTVDLPIRP
ncbi:PAS domain S-box protein [Planosporangium mesophilum]|nr:PAS domain S-box protein [Planosporangium mesophilum]